MLSGRVRFRPAGKTGIFFEPRKCSEPDCISDEVFTSISAWEKHIEQAHRERTPQPCPTPSCSRGDFVCLLRFGSRAHLRKKHKDELDPEGYARYAPPSKRRRIDPEVRYYNQQRCSHPDFTVETIFATFNDYFEHAQIHHGARKESKVSAVPPLGVRLFWPESALV